MEARTTLTVSAIALSALIAAGCSNNGTTLSTASVAPNQVAAAPKIDPACTTLASQIETLRAEGTPERLEKAAEGKSASVQIKRASLAKQAELNKANADFQMKCGPKLTKAQTAAVVPGPPTQPTVAAIAPTTASNSQTAAAPTALAPRN
ncbi:MAG: hypothetical protein CTY31_07160 [Hyphomicrobium sp.]|nr:MAG: hypothetical protein CTY39_02380 [Hyphomicrobium sp.]PPC99688.1 MAG: hypothetical protein CTY31_07160 [Hyphomicrobium sp.]